MVPRGRWIWCSSRENVHVIVSTSFLHHVLKGAGVTSVHRRSRRMRKQENPCDKLCLESLIYGHAKYKMNHRVVSSYANVVGLELSLAFDPHHAQRTCRAIGRFDDSNVTYPCFIRARGTECGCRARLSLVCRLLDAKRRSAVTRRAPAPRPPRITLPALDTTCRMYIPVSDVSSQFTMKLSCHSG
jgi:hypothetical protein